MLSTEERQEMVQKLDQLEEMDIDAWYQVVVRVYGESAGGCAASLAWDLEWPEKPGPAQRLERISRNLDEAISTVESTLEMSKKARRVYGGAATWLEGAFAETVEYKNGLEEGHDAAEIAAAGRRLQYYRQGAAAMERAARQPQYSHIPE